VKTKIVILFLLLTLPFFSCTGVLKKLYGIEYLKDFDRDKYEETIKELRAIYPEGNIEAIVSNSSDFKKYHALFSNLEKNNLTQPIQILYFEHKDLKSYHLNCYAKGNLLGKLDWNSRNYFNTYIPQTSYSIPNTIQSTFDDLGAIYNLQDLEPRDVIVLFWTHMLKKQTMSGFRTVVKNLREYHTGEAPRIILINTDAFYIEYEDTKK